MGCCSSSSRFDANISLDGFYTNPLGRSMKRSYSSRISNASSGVFSRCTTPSRRSQSTTSNASLRNRKKGNKKTQTLSDNFGILSIVDDFAEAQQLAQAALDKSCGYFTKSISSSSDGGISKASLRYTRDGSIGIPNADGCHMTYSTHSSQSFERPDSPTGCDLEMEMFMMTNTRGVIGKTSSPMLQRRDASEDATYNVSCAPRPSASYNKWSKFLQTTPAYIINNVTNIPEAVAGHFCPSDFPAFIDVEIEGNAPKRIKLDNAVEVQVDIHGPPAMVPYNSAEL